MQKQGKQSNNTSNDILDGYRALTENSFGEHSPQAPPLASGLFGTVYSSNNNLLQSLDMKSR